MTRALIRRAAFLLFVISAAPGVRVAAGDEPRRDDEAEQVPRVSTGPQERAQANAQTGCASCRLWRRLRLLPIEGPQTRQDP